MSEYAIYLVPEGVGTAQASWPVRVRRPDGSMYRSRLDDLAALAGHHVALVLPMELFAYCQAGPLPGRRPGRDALAFAVEERLATPLEELHLAFGAADESGSRPCLAIDRACLEQVLAWVRAQGVEPLAVLADADLLSSADPTALWLEGRWLLGGKHRQRLALSPAAAQVLAASMPEVSWLAEPGQALQEGSYEPVADAFALLWEGRVQAIDLRQGIFAPTRGLSLPWQGLLAGCLLAGLLVCLADYWRAGWLQQQAAQLHQDNVNAFERWAPGQPPRDDLARQVSELVQRPQPATSMQRLALLSEPLVESGGLWIERAERTASHGWRVEVVARGFDDLERLRERLPGVQVGQAQQQEAQRVSATLVWESGQ
ncbi:type II secretion system protein GspL [Pseudomonas sp. NPDC089554]|uniref:type II secretion system protein GspL n=1 Tax=Pseudomonas sp. NPDC089554 TaxID=3390653 RepID=UPI003D024BB5